MIEVAGLRKTYAGFPAVVDVSFEVEPGEVFGIVGPNGAGKTTTLKMLAGLVEPTAGTATVAGYDAADPAMRRLLGYLPEESPLYEDMTPRSYLRFFADLYGVEREVADERIADSLDRLELEYRDRRIGDMSKGMKRKVAITRSLVNDPDVLLYDEPASGLDPLTTNYVLEFTRDLRDRGKTVVFSAHNLYHVESVCDRVVIVNEGEIVARGTVPEIRAEHGETRYHVFTDVPVEGAEPVDGGAADGAEPIDRRAIDQGVAEEPERTNRRFRVVCADMDGVESVRERAADAGGSVLDIRTRESSLEDVFLELAARSVDGERAGAAK